MSHGFVVHVPVVWESADGRQVRGVRQITPGVVTDTEADELFDLTDETLRKACAISP